MPLKPQVQTFLDMLQASGRKPPHLSTPAESRAAAVARRALMGTGPELKQVEDKDIPAPHGTVKARLFVPEGELLSLILYFHGGGWVIGALDDFDAMARQLAIEAQSAVLLVDYRLAPENRFPAAAEDAWAALEWSSANLAQLVGAPLPIVMAGDSAGGNLAAGATLRARDAGGPGVALQVLIYPVTDTNFETASYHKYADGPFLTRDSMIWFWDQYAPDHTVRGNPLASPLRARSFRGLPPAVILTAEYDPLTDEVAAYADALRKADVHVTHRHFAGTIHGFFTMFRILDDSLDAVRFVGGAVRRAMRPTS
jgi:acetyl esterase